VTDPRVEKLARLLVEYSLAVRPGDMVLIGAPVTAAPLVREVYRHALRAGGHPEVRLHVEEAEQVLLAEGSEEQIAWVNRTNVEEAEQCDCRLYVLAPQNTRALTGADPVRQALAEAAAQPVLGTLLERSARGELRSVVTALPTHALAQEAGMSLAAYARFLFGACRLGEADPVASWRELGERLARLVEWLAGVRELRVVGPGTDLSVPVAGRRWIAADGRENMPDGEVFTAPHEDGVEGAIAFALPALYSGQVIEGVRLVLRGGEVVEATARRGEALLHEMLRVDDGARRVGEFAFGLNDLIQRATGETLLDEKIGGTIHLALGHAYEECGGTNRSALHWDLVCDLREGGEVYADGALVYRDGRFVAGPHAAA
jgi:aminopeptidase